MLKTMLYVATTVILILLAWMSAPAPVQPKIFSDKGELFFPDFKDPAQATALEVVEFDTAKAELRPFKVHLQNNRWTIPSHHDYPADAKEQMARAAGLFIGLTKTDIRSDNSADHKSLGVVDPSGENPGSEGLGTKVTFSDAGGKVIASLILGKEVKERQGMHYVRLPDRKRTYIAKLPGKVSTKFEEWIETDILMVGAMDIVRLIFDTSSVDEERGPIKGEINDLRKREGKWTAEKVPEGRESKVDAIETAAATLDNLKIFGVRAKPAGLTRQLTVMEQIRLDERDVFSLASHGFFLFRGALYSNEGELTAITSKGVVYTMRFGEIALGAGLDITAGSDKEPPKDAPPTERKKEGGIHRYLMITAQFDEKAVDPPAGTPLDKEQMEKRKSAAGEIRAIRNAVETFKAKNGKLPESIADLTVGGDQAPLKELKKDPWGGDYILMILEGDTYEIICFGADKAEKGDGENTDLLWSRLEQEPQFQKTIDDHEAFRKRLDEGRAEAKKLSARFAPWYYVIDDESFKKLHLGGGQLFQTKGREGGKEKEQHEDDVIRPR